MNRMRLAAAALIGTLALAGCGIGFDAGTQTQGPSRHMGTTVDGADLHARSGNLVVDPAHPGTALFVGTLINPTASDNALTGVSADPSVLSKAAIDGAVELPAGVPVQFGYNGGHTLVLTSTSGKFTPGTNVTVVLALATGEPLNISLPVKTNTGDYADVVIPQPSASATPSPTPTPSAS